MSSGSWDSFFRTVLGSGSSDRAEDNFTLATFDDSVCVLEPTPEPRA